MRLFRILSFLIVLTLGISTAFAQGTANYSHAAVFGRIGWSTVYSTATLGPTSVVDNEAMIAGGAEYRPISHLGFEFDAARMHQHKTGFNVTPTDGSVAFLDWNAVVHFAEGRVQPYAFGGGGLMILTENLAPPTGTRTGRVFTGGGGMDIGLTSHWFVRGEGRLYSPRIFDKVFMASAGIAYHW